ncbi:replication initiator protein [Hypnocyclicus thermotrophus]|uniref:Replication initiator protein n=1 Tax=Hypnocyclicus thermotrophus TaxID=1627895 RepID=A0AA46E0G9_9FUSO|nr:replication initiation protein [Hypnocyclicus thermotrophus]TDT72481.1 replication initiator protein [Hypnocyclicus thermotrophus]
MKIPYLNNYYIYIQNEKKITKREREYLNILIDEFSKFKKNLIYDIETVKKNFDISVKDFYEILISISNKRYIFEIYELESKIAEGIFSIINSIKMSKDILEVEFNEILFEALNPDSIFYKFGFLSILKIESQNILDLYNYFLRYLNRNKGEFEIEIEKLKNILQVEEKYGRFYDFERYVLKNIIEELNNKSDYIFRYEKIKIGNSKNNRIKSLKFYFENRKELELFNNIDELLNIIKYEIKNFEKFKKLFYLYLNKKNIKYIKNNIEFIKEHFDGDYEEYLEKALKENYYSNHFKILDKNGERLDLLVDLESEYHNIFQFETDIYKILKEIKFYYDIDFLKKLYEFRKNKILFYEDKTIKIIGEYNKNSKSFLKIYKK